MSDGKKTKKDISFEEAVERLEKIVRMLESGSVPLDDSLVLFEEGVELVKTCNSKLDAVQQKITLLTKDGETPFEAGE
ncbi:MAG: exodeoxyribonuclease VII small subunit [Clostridia bacterium]|nr:exodeoxyribonuclease VII small subunit [Clostridia bacterium]